MWSHLVMTNILLIKLDKIDGLHTKCFQALLRHSCDTGLPKVLARTNVFQRTYSCTNTESCSYFKPATPLRFPVTQRRRSHGGRRGTTLPQP